MPTLVYLTLTCFICGQKKSEARNLRSHFLAVHSINVPARDRYVQRRDTDDFIYIKRLGSKQHTEVKEHYECPSCLFHSEDAENLRVHVFDTHVQSDTLTRKRDVADFQDSEEDKSTNIEKRHSARQGEVSISNSRNAILTFYKPAQQSIDRPKMSEKTIASLKGIVDIVAPYNAQLPPHLVQALGKYEHDQSTLKYLKMFPKAHSMLLSALDQTLDDLPLWTWSYIYPGSISIREKQLLKTIQFSLTAFADRSTSPSQRESTYERTYFVKYVVPFLQTFSQQTGYLDFEWCEIRLQQCTRMDKNVSLWSSPALRYVDGLGYDVNGEERLVVEASSGQKTEHLQHTVDDTAKQIHSSICMLQGISSEYPNARFNTLRKMKIYGIQCVRTRVTLSQTSFDENGKYLYEEVRSVKIPTRFKEATRLIRLMDLLSYLLIEMHEQDDVLTSLREENDGKVEVEEIDQVKTVLFAE